MDHSVGFSLKNDVKRNGRSIIEVVLEGSFVASEIVLLNRSFISFFFFYTWKVARLWVYCHVELKRISQIEGNK